MVELYVQCQKNFLMFSALLCRMFEYLNKYYIKLKNLAELGEKCMTLYKTLYFEGQKNEIREAVLLQITKDRKGQIVDKETLKMALKYYTIMGLQKPAPKKVPTGFEWLGTRDIQMYKTEFEAYYLPHSKTHFEAQANEWFSGLNCPEYLNKVKEALEHEEDNADYWLQPETKPLIVKIVEQQLITRKAEQVADKETGCEYMFQHKNLDELQLMYELFKRDESVPNDPHPALTLII